MFFLPYINGTGESQLQDHINFLTRFINSIEEAEEHKFVPGNRLVLDLQCSRRIPHPQASTGYNKATNIFNFPKK